MPDEQANETIVNTNSQEDELEKPIINEPSSTVEDNVDLESKLKPEESKPTFEPPVIDPTKTGENIKTNLSMVVEHSLIFLFYHRCLLHNACSALKCIFLQKKYPNCLLI